jgi:hypothetical protein
LTNSSSCPRMRIFWLRSAVGERGKWSRRRGWSADSGLESGNPGGGSLRFCQRRQPEQQRSQSHAAIKGARGRDVLTYGRECVTGSRKAHRRSTDGQRSDSKRGWRECGGFEKRSLREAGSEAGAKAAAFRTRGNRRTKTQRTGPTLTSPYECHNCR